MLFINLTLFADPCSAALLGAAHSGAPGEVSCAACHSGNPNSGPGSINYLIGNGTLSYSPGELYTILFSMEEDNVNQFGFQTVALKASDNTNVGTFSLTDTDETRLIEDDHNGSDRIYVGHTICGADTDTLGEKQWSFDWQAPDTDIGDIDLYLASLATNHNHSTSGDHTYTQVITLSYNEVILGDINGDEILNVLDIVLMINMILANDYNIVADVNEDGSVSILDVVIMVNILVGGLP
jgi:hypothetical protein